MSNTQTNPTIAVGKHRRLILILGLLCLVLYLALCAFAGSHVSRSVDYSTMMFLQTIIGRFADFPFSLITPLGSAEITLVICMVFVLLLAVRKKYIFFGMSVFILIFIVELIGKLSIYHPPPPKIFFRNVLNFSFPSASIIDTHYSFPSGHMARSAFLVTVIIGFSYLLHLKKPVRYRIAAFSLVFIILIFFSRIYLGEHWLTDVLGGLFLGTGTGLLSLLFI